MTTLAEIAREIAKADGYDGGEAEGFPANHYACLAQAALTAYHTILERPENVERWARVMQQHEAENMFATNESVIHAILRDMRERLEKQP